MGTGVIVITHHRRKLRLREGPGCLEVHSATWLQFVLDLAHRTPPAPPPLLCASAFSGQVLTGVCPGVLEPRLGSSLGRELRGDLGGGPHCARSMELAPGSLN